MSNFKFSGKSLKRLEGVHPNLVKVMKRAIELSEVDFSIIQGVRTIDEQRRLVAEGKSLTLNSRHLVQKDGYGYAVDVVPYPVNWSLYAFYPIAEAVRKAAEELNIKVRWGGAWTVLNGSNDSPEMLVERYSTARRKVGNKVFIDAPHFEIIAK